MVSPAVGNHVDEAIPVQVCSRYGVRVRIRMDRQSAGGEAPIPVVDENRDVAALMVGDDDVDAPVAVDVGADNSEGMLATEPVRSRLRDGSKRAMAITREQQEGARLSAQDGIDAAIARKVGDRKRVGMKSGRQWDGDGVNRDRASRLARRQRDAVKSRERRRNEGES
jgi:hypothetical protein